MRFQLVDRKYHRLLLLTDDASSIQLPTFPKKKDQFFTARKLIGSSLFRHNQDSAEYWMHRVTQDVVRGKIEPDRQIIIFSEAVSIISSVWPARDVGGHDVKLWQFLEKLCPYVTSLKELYKLYFKPNHDDIDMGFASLLNRAGWYV
ncbi:hypothetical protein RRF57_013376 [Xylaria bambusicola]|uniref:DUF7779 domain-containing protein n=1 Tax=Xylaria bambusicola TaxID=326684 RepID=A0AAN7V1N0_9PEZI